MKSLVKLESCGFGETGKALEFSFSVVEDIPVESVTIESEVDDSLVTLDVSRDFDKEDNLYTLNSTGKSSVIAFTNTHLVLVTVTLDEEAVQDYLMEHYISDCTSEYKTAILPIYTLLPLRFEALKYTGELDSCNCTISHHFLNKVLHIDAIKYSISCSLFDEAKDLWREFYSLSKSKGGRGHVCGCKGS